MKAWLPYLLLLQTNRKLSTKLARTISYSRGGGCTRDTKAKQNMPRVTAPYSVDHIDIVGHDVGKSLFGLRGPNIERTTYIGPIQFRNSKSRFLLTETPLWARAQKLARALCPVRPLCREGCWNTLGVVSLNCHPIVIYCSLIVDNPNKPPYFKKI